MRQSHVKNEQILVLLVDRWKNYSLDKRFIDCRKCLYGEEIFNEGKNTWHSG